MFYNAHKENMFTINLENGRENLNTKNYSFKEKKEERKKKRKRVRKIGIFQEKKGMGERNQEQG